MKLKSFVYKHGYVFLLEFTNHRTCEIDLSPLLKAYIKPLDMLTAQIDPEWGCLMFKNGMVDIEPKTLYSFAFGKPHYAA
ncbi:DUF2442 domain-containing protein [Thiomicrospira microaerophila]|uniref:DUF2442 domain-containing protein n=1 Tax=Thiomicrospira microaerophila TaxID=406020 RepID=UPI0005CAC043|nr:DUF2442 domain-containing protein [Thiomicrospira microaerophila]